MYEGRASDILDKPQALPAATRWTYKMDLSVGDNTYRITFDDWMFLMNDGILINRSYLKKLVHSRRTHFYAKATTSMSFYQDKIIWTAGAIAVLVGPSP